MGVELPVVLRTRWEKADALGLFDLLEEGDVALGDVGQQPDIQDAQRRAGQQRPADEAQVEAEQIALLATDGMLVKRPLLIGDAFVLAGFRPADWEAALQ